MVETPNMIIQEGFVLRPASSVLLSLLVDAYHEDPEGVHSALPWMEDTKIPQQFGQMLRDIERAGGEDHMHFWSIHEPENSEFVGLIGLGDELQLDDTDYNLGYWVVKQYQRKGIAKDAVNNIMKWLDEREENFRVELIVHPHNEAGIATAQSIIDQWNGYQIPQLIGVEVNKRTVPHHIFVIEV